MGYRDVDDLWPLKPTRRQRVIAKAILSFGLPYLALNFVIDLSIVAHILAIFGSLAGGMWALMVLSESSY